MADLTEAQKILLSIGELFICTECDEIMDPYSDHFVTTIICGKCLDKLDAEDFSEKTVTALMSFKRAYEARTGGMN